MEESFQGVVCGYDVKIVLGSQGVGIELWHGVRQKRYWVFLANEWYEMSRVVQEVFTNFDVFYAYFCENAKDKKKVFIDEDGTITVVYHAVRMRNKRFARVDIDTQLMVDGPQIKQESKLSNSMGVVKCENLILHDKIRQLSRLVQDREEQMDKLTNLTEISIVKSNDAEYGAKRYIILSQGGAEGVTELKQTIGAVRKEMDDFKGLMGCREPEQDSQIRNTGIQLKDKEKRRESSQSRERRQRRQRKKQKKDKRRREKQRKKSKYRNHKSKYSSEDETESTRQLRITPINNIRETQDASTPDFGRRLWITVDLNNQYLASQFKVQGSKITKINEYGPYQILSNQVIPPTGRHYFDMHIVRLSFQLISLGIVAQSRRNFKNSHQHEDLVSYYPRAGVILQSGSSRSGGRRIPNGVCIRIVVDMDRHSVKWYRDGRQLGGTVMNQKLWRERMVAYLEFNYQDDVVCWNTTNEMRVERGVGGVGSD